MESAHPDQSTDWAFFDLHLSLAVPYRWAHGVQHERHVLLVRGGAGWGEMAPPPHEAWDGQAAIAAARAAAARLNDPEDDLDDVSPRLRHALTTAAMDDAARREGVPLAAWLAERHGRKARPSVPVNRLLTDAEPARLAQQAAAAVEEGIDTLKLKVGADVDTDLSRVAAVRRGAPDARIRLDANTALPPEHAAAALEAFASHGIEYIEQPLPPEDVDGLVRLQEAGAVPIALDESATDAATIGRLLDAGAGSVVILKPQRLGGLDRTIAAIEAAEVRGATAVVTNSLESSVGVHAALHAAALLRQEVACGLATSHYLAEDVAPAPRVEAGRMRVPGPGLGVAPEVSA